jgi:hypothetical protein
MARLRDLACLCLVVACLATGRTRALASEPELWGDLKLVGGAEAARRVFGLSPQDHRLAAEWLPDFIHRYGQLEAWDEAARRFGIYVQYLDRVRRAAAQWPKGVRVPGPGDQPAEREKTRSFFELIGLKVSDSGGRVVVDIDNAKPALEHIDWLTAAGVDVRAAAGRLNAGEIVPFSIIETTLPLPLPDFWTSKIFRKDRMPIEDLIADRSAAMLYLGLLTLDDETLGFLANRPDVLLALREGAPTFGSIAAESLRVRNNRLDVPGGPEADSIWFNLVGRQPAQPAEFMRELTRRDEGRLAYFYTVVERLDRSRQAFVLGQHLPAAQRNDFVKALYGRFRAIDPTWRIPRHPFHRPSPDPSLVLIVLDVDNGHLGPGWLAPMLDRIVATEAWPGKAQLGQPVKDRPADALWAMTWLYVRPNESLARFKLLRFAQRRFMKVDRSAIPDLDSALRCAWQMPALAFSLERMGVADVTVYARAAGAGHALSTSDSADRAALRVARWQAAFALLDQVQRRRPLSPDRLRGLILSLADTAVTPANGVQATVADWLTQRLLAELSPVPIDRLTEREAIHLLVHGPEEPVLRLTWEGLSYVFDEAVPIERDVVALRAASPAPDLSRLVNLSRLADGLTSGVKSAEGLRTWLSEFALERSTVERLPFDADQVKPLVESFDRIVKSLEKIESPKDLPRAAREAPAVDAIVDAVSDAVLPPLVYALAITPLNRPAAIFADTWHQHSLRPLSGEPLWQWQRTAWRLAAPEARDGGGTRVRGSLLGLDVALSESRLVRPPADGFKLDDAQIKVLADTLVLAGSPPGDAEADATLAALARARITLQGWRASPPPRARAQAALASAVVDPRRANVVLWTLAHEPDAAGRALTMTELVRLGGGRIPDGWSTQMNAIDGCPCTKALPARPVDDWRGSWHLGVPVAANSDLSLRLAEHLRRLRLPAFLVDAVRPAAASEWLGHVRPFAPDDWEALAGWPHDLLESDVEKHILNLIARGILSGTGTGSIR